MPCETCYEMNEIKVPKEVRVLAKKSEPTMTIFENTEKNENEPFIYDTDQDSGLGDTDCNSDFSGEEDNDDYEIKVFDQTKEITEEEYKYNKLKIQKIEKRLKKIDEDQHLSKLQCTVNALQRENSDLKSKLECANKNLKIERDSCDNYRKQLLEWTQALPNMIQNVSDQIKSAPVTIGMDNNK